MKQKLFKQLTILLAGILLFSVITPLSTRAIAPEDQQRLQDAADQAFAEAAEVFSWLRRVVLRRMGDDVLAKEALSIALSDSELPFTAEFDIPGVWVLFVRATAAEMAAGEPILSNETRELIRSHELISGYNTMFVGISMAVNATGSSEYVIVPHHRLWELIWPEVTAAPNNDESYIFAFLFQSILPPPMPTPFPTPPPATAVPASMPTPAPQISQPDLIHEHEMSLIEAFLERLFRIIERLTNFNR